MLSVDQMQLKEVRLVRGLAQVVGVLSGCVLGMFPLLFLDSPSRSDLVHDDDEGVYVGEKGLSIFSPNVADEDSLWPRRERSGEEWKREWRLSEWVSLDEAHLSRSSSNH